MGIFLKVIVDIRSEQPPEQFSTLEGEGRLKRLMLHDIDVADIVEVDQGLIKRPRVKGGFICTVFDDCGSEEDLC